MRVVPSASRSLSHQEECGMVVVASLGFSLW